jgi:hypothetical protein
MQPKVQRLSVHQGWVVAALSLAGACQSSDSEAGAALETTPDAGALATPAPQETTSSGSSQSAKADAATAATPGATSNAGGCQTFDSSYAAIQALVFERHGCTAAACHGQAKVGGLDLSAGTSWDALVDVPSTNSGHKRIEPGAPGDSYLFQKLVAATEPGSVQVAGSPMPIGAAALSAKELEAVKLWILKGAPKSGVVTDPLKGSSVGDLLDACLPAATPIKIKPLEAPAPAEGFQLRLPAFTLKGGSETEHCTPFAYDFSKLVPAQYRDEARNVIFTNGSQVRQDPQSHHMVVWNPQKGLDSVPENDPDWTCHGGVNDGKACNPRKGSADCGEAVCAGKTVPGTFCNGDSSAVITGMGEVTLDAILSLVDVFASTGGSLPGQIASTQTPQQVTPALDGVFTEIPLRGIFWFNLHAFNLADQDTTLEPRVNYLYAKDRKREMKLVTDSSQVYIAAGTPPFTRKTYCAKSVVPEHYQIATLASHTHRRGEHFWVKDATGKQIYESFDYSDPAYTRFTPWLAFDAPDEASRTLEYCATFNNGLTKDDKPDLSLVTRASRMPDRTTCTPVACVAGKVTAACTTDHDCDSAPGANDGDCDACPITGGPTTENEMFALMPWYVMPPGQ